MEREQETAFGGTGLSGAWGPAPSSTRRRRRRRLGAGAAVGAAVVVAAGGIGAGIGLGFGSSASGTSATTGASTPKASTAAAVSSNGHLNVAAIAAKVDPALVDITSTLGYQGASAAGTGMILTSSGQVLTNNHVVEGATKITVRIDGSGPSYSARVLGTDPTKDVALLQIQGAPKLHTVQLASSAPHVGEPVVAIGNALNLAGPPTVTDGIVSALGRSITAGGGSALTEHLSGLIQSDAPINPGNSGGPLLDAAGKVIGMNTAAATGTSTQSASNIGFAIPISNALSVVSQIRAAHAGNGVSLGLPGFLGVEITSTSALGQSNVGFGLPTGSATVSSGVAVMGVLPGSPAASAGLSGGDVITSVAGHAVSSPRSLSAIMATLHPGERVALGWVGTAGNQHTSEVTLAAGPAA